jgi:dihydrofolate reductase
MRHIYLFMMVSLDGYFEGEDHDLSWHTVDDEFNEYAHEQLRNTGAILFGKTTYQMMAAFWPTPQGQAVDKETANAMNVLPKYVASHQPFETKWINTTVLSGDVAGEVSKLKNESGKNVAILGSNTLCVSLMKKGLVDEFRIMVNPRAINKGTPLFAGLERPMRLKLIDSRIFKSGNVLNRYAIAGAVIGDRGEH